MATSAHSVREPSLRRRGRAAFSLVEVTLAIGIMAFAFISVLGLLPTGLNTFHRAMDTSVGTQISSRIINEAQQTDFSTLVGSNTGTVTFRQTSPASPSVAYRYFDDQGDELNSPNGAVYQANTLITPVTVTPYTGGGPPPAQAQNSSLATVVVQIANNPGGRQILTDGTGVFWSDSRFPIVTYTGFVAGTKKP